MTLVGGGKYDFVDSGNFRPQFHMNLIYDVLRPNNKVNVNISGINYQVTGDNINPLGIETGVCFGLYSGSWDVFFGYDLEWRSNFISHTGHLKAKYVF